MKRLITFASVPLIATFAGCHSSHSSIPPEQPIPAEVLVIGSAASGQTISVAGTVKPRLEVDMSAQILAPVTTVTRREGERFRKGDLLVRLSAPALNASVAQSDAALQSARNQETVASVQAKLAADTLARYTQLREHHSVTPSELEQVRTQNAAAAAQQQTAAAQVSVAEAAMAAQRANASDASLYAPFAGVVARRMVDPGAMAAPGTPLLHLQSLGATNVEFYVPDTLYSSLRIGSTLPISDASTTINATVANISPSADPAAHSFLVKALLPDSATWSAGTVVQVKLQSVNTVRSLAVPRSAILEQGGLDAVVALDRDDRARVRYVTLGSTSADSVQILTGLAPGDRILSSGDLALAGRKIEVRP